MSSALTISKIGGKNGNWFDTAFVNASALSTSPGEMADSIMADLVQQKDFKNALSVLRTDILALSPDTLCCGDNVNKLAPIEVFTKFIRGTNKIFGFVGTGTRRIDIEQGETILSQLFLYIRDVCNRIQKEDPDMCGRHERRSRLSIEKTYAMVAKTDSETIRDSEKNAASVTKAVGMEIAKKLTVPAIAGLTTGGAINVIGGRFTKALNVIANAIGKPPPKEVCTPGWVYGKTCIPTEIADADPVGTWWNRYLIQSLEALRDGLAELIRGAGSLNEELGWMFSMMVGVVVFILMLGLILYTSNKSGGGGSIASSANQLFHKRERERSPEAAPKPTQAPRTVIKQAPIKRGRKSQSPPNKRTNRN